MLARISTIAESVVGLLLLGSKMFRYLQKGFEDRWMEFKNCLEHRNIELFSDVENRDNYQ